jgi:hypothetical protein
MHRVLPQEDAMMPESFEPLGFRDNVFLARINLCSAAIALLVFAFLFDDGDWSMRALAAVISAVLILLARQMESVIRRLDPEGEREATRRDHEHVDDYLMPF